MNNNEATLIGLLIAVVTLSFKAVVFIVKIILAVVAGVGITIWSIYMASKHGALYEKKEAERHDLLLSILINMSSQPLGLNLLNLEQVAQEASNHWYLLNRPIDEPFDVIEVEYALSVLDLSLL
jgi:hypothetical protein